jgi:hypothetical protein
VRSPSSFCQDGQAGREQAQGFLIYPGRVAGVLGRDILLEESLDPSRHQRYQAAQAVIARMGGRLSHSGYANTSSSGCNLT